ncbi:bacillithiol biosynthesis cysteine-adding enzyme BshC [Brevibacillus daliensis]|uniref:bacillithiol biosynthesis cysteine-adding enzyme BshC n=1 Tax=Brevibacillus daliensis TaxID=2892995 RepID=UPI001E3A71BD|nr:bacillithiol biosynthesis cysteine-adding enzyme BshC [Brevibacillus daliensis]
MKNIPVSLHAPRSFLTDYKKESVEALSFFTYSPFAKESYLERMQYVVSKNDWNRDELSDALYRYNRQVGNHQEALANIEELKKPDTLAVITGQQAGLLTGPLYTIYKAIDTIQLAREQSMLLGVKVVPVFWIAGEDHDFDEVNHFFQQTLTGEARKITIATDPGGKRSVSAIKTSQDEMLQIVEQFFTEELETDHSQELRQLLLGTARESDTLADWFALLLVKLFGKHGLILIESSDPAVRQMESRVFKEVIRKNKELSRILLSTQARLQACNYPNQLELYGNQAHFFLYEQEERLLMERARNGFQAKDGGRLYSEDELLQILETSPERFSANVVSRPLMQEHLIPTLAYVAGPGELLYWANFKDAFSLFGQQVPLVVPRTSYVLVEGNIDRLLQKHELRIDTLFHHMDQWKNEWLNALDEPGFHEKFEQQKQEVQNSYQKLLQEVVTYDKGLLQLAEANRKRLLDDISFMQERVRKAIHLKHQVSIDQIVRIEQALLPDGKWQERVYTIFAYMNRYGLDLIDLLLEKTGERNGSVQIVHL